MAPKKKKENFHGHFAVISAACIVLLGFAEWLSTRRLTEAKNLRAPASAAQKKIQFECDTGGKVRSFVGVEPERAKAVYDLEDWGKRQVSLFYPYRTPYAYAMGYQPRKGHPNILPNVEMELKQLVYSSIAMKVDPYAMLAIGLMENPNSIHRLNQHVHDRNSARTLGCNPHANQVKQVVEWKDPDLLEDLQDQRVLLLGNEHKVLGKGTSYACIGKLNSKDSVSDYDGLALLSKPSEKHYCCAKIPFSLPEVSSTYPSNYFTHPALTLVSTAILGKWMHRLTAPELGHGAACVPPGKMKLPEFRLQSFLGFSPSTGRGMTNTVAPFRLGVNSCVDPNYGIQAMDYLVNTLHPHPKIAWWVQQAELAQKKSVPNLLCLGKKPGQYILDADAYLKKHFNSVRYQKLFDHYKTGKKAFDIKTPFDLNSLMKEFLEVPYVKEILGKKVGEARLDSLALRYKSSSSVAYQWIESPHMNEKQIYNEAFEEYFSNPKLYEARNTLGKTSRMDSPEMTWERFTDAEFASALEAVRKNMTD
ncbi:MAG: hypothetical protein JNL01_09290 [Bdellovibrionales bacterium]|nr:hypothetical protein [Bdellovibrionales bacterium]